LDSYLSMFSRKSTGNMILSQDMIRGGPPAPNNHSKKRKLSSNERMINSTKKKSCCSLCFRPKHKASRCHLLNGYKAWLVPWKSVNEIATTLGNPLYFEISVPDKETQQAMERWIASGNSNTITEDAIHLVLQNSYFSPIPDQPFKYNVLEVTVLGKGGLHIPGFEKAYYPVHTVVSWVLKNCTVTRRKKHL
jgi:hypothetical protein